MSYLNSPPGNRHPIDRNGETPEFAAFLAGSVEGMRSQTDAHRQTWHLGEEEYWDVDQDLGTLVFTFATVIATAPVQIIGTFDNKAGTWMWAWANSSISEAMSQDALRVRAYGEEHGIERLTTDLWNGDEAEGWEMAALAIRLCEANGTYRAQTGTTSVFMTFGEVQLQARE